MGKFYWLKLKKDFFKRHDIRIIEGKKDGDRMVLFYLKLLCESVDHDGALRFSDEVPYDNDMLASVTNTEKELVDEAMQILKKLGMIKTKNDGTIIMCGVDSMLGSETAWAEKKRQQRELPALGNGAKRINAEMMKLADGTVKFVDEKRYGGNGMFVIARANGKCEKCGSDSNVVIHHNNGFSTEPDDLICLCSKCHGEVHSETWGGHFPPSVLHIVHPMSSTCPQPVLSLSDKRKSIEKEKELEKDISKREKGEILSPALSGSPKKRFIPPTVDEVRAYCIERKNGIDPEAFVAFYASKNWYVGKSKMVDWKASVRTWEQRRKQEAGSARSDIPIMEKTYSEEDQKQKESLDWLLGGD